MILSEKKAVIQTMKLMARSTGCVNPTVKSSGIYKLRRLWESVGIAVGIA
jgi:hypothetical protein